MKARLFMFMALVLGLASCQTEPEGLNVVLDGEQDVIVNVVVPEAETRAGVDSAESVFGNGILDGDLTMRYILQIYDENGNPSKERLVKYSDGESVSFSVRLVPDRGYAFVVWADVVAGEADNDLYYNTRDLAQVTVIDTDNKWNAMNEARDAFTGKSVVTNFQGTSTIDVELTRPFAKLRVVTTDFDELDKFDIEAKKAVATYTTKHYRTFNAYGASFEADAGVALDKTVENVAHEYIITEYTGETGDNHTIFTDYFFASAGSPDIINLTLNVYEDEAKQRLIKSNNFNTDIPVQRNYLTTLKGDVLTTNGNVSIVVKPGFGDEIVEKYADNAETLQEIINEAPVGEQTNITLGGDIDLNDLLNAGILSTRASEPTYGLLIPADKEVVLDLNGHTISQTKTQTTAYSMIDNRGTLIIKDSSEAKTGKLNYTDNGQGGEYVSNTLNNSGVLTIESGTIENNSSATVAANGYPHPIDNSGTLVINGGTFTNNANYSSMRIWCTTDDNTIVTINGGTFNGSIDFQTPGAAANKGTLTINGGTFNADTYTNTAVRLLGFGADVDEMNGYIMGGYFNCAIALRNWSGSDFNSKVFNITGGTFTTAAKEATDEALLDGDYEFVSDGENWVVSKKPAVAKIGDVEYTSLIKAAAAVQDGETITLLANETFTNKNYSDNGGWKDGLYYVGDKSFTIDLDGKTIGQNGDLNDYLLNFKNVGSKANTITLKNGTLDAGKTAFCALCTSSSHENQLTINTENITITNNISNGSTVKVRGGAILNVKAGTKIIGKNSYLGIECAASTVNIYDGAEIYMNGTSSYNGCLAGACYGGTINVYGGYGKGVKGGFIAMTSGGTINVSGGEWIANTDGTIGDNSNLYVLTAQSNKYESGFVGGAYVNVTGGTLRGGMDAWVLNNIEGEVAELNISGGNFNANPSAYLTVGCEATESNGIWTVRVLPVAKIGETEYDTLQEAFNVGGNITLLRNVAVAETVVLAEGKTVVLDLNGKTLSATDMNTIKNNGGVLTIKNGTVTRTGDAVGYSVNNASGEIAVENATIERGLYTSGSKMTATNANISHEQSSRHAIYAWDCAVTINSGNFHNDNAGNATLMASGSSVVTINGGTFSIADGRSVLGWTSSMIDQNSTAQVIVKGGLFNGGFRINSADTTLTIEGGEFNTNNGSAFTDYSGTKVVKGGKFTDAGAQNWAKKYIADGYEMNANGEVVVK